MAFIGWIFVIIGFGWALIGILTIFNFLPKLVNGTMPFGIGALGLLFTFLIYIAPGLLVGRLGVVRVGVVSKRKKKEEEKRERDIKHEINENRVDLHLSTDTKICPQCAEEVKAAAKICRFCRYEFPESSDQIDLQIVKEETAPLKTKFKEKGDTISPMKKGHHERRWVGILLILFIIIGFLWDGSLFRLATEISRFVSATTGLILPNFSTSPKPHWEGGQIIRPDTDQINKANEYDKKVQGQAPSYTLSANQLYRDYKDNEVAADQKYKGRIVVVSGTIQSIGKDILDQAYIVIGGEGFLDGVQCMFTKGEESSVARLSNGQRVAVKGEVSGKMVGNVLLKKCTLQ